MTKSGRRHLRHARIGQPSDRRAFSRNSINSRLLSIDFQMSEDEEAEEIFFRPIPVSRVMTLRNLNKGGEAIVYQEMLALLSEFVVDPQTGESLTTAEEWDAFGIDGVKAVVEAMIEGAQGIKVQGGDTEAGPTRVVETAIIAAAQEVLDGDPEIAAAFESAVLAKIEERKKAAEMISEQEQKTEQTAIEEVPIIEGELPKPAIFRMPEVPETEIPISAPNGTSAETPLPDSPSSSTDI